MATTQLRGTQFLDGTVRRNDLDVATPGEAVIRKIIQGTNVSITSTGVDAGTGDVTINVPGGGQGIFGGDSQPYTFSTTVTMADPGSGNVRLNNATVASATAIAVSLTNSDAVGILNWFNQISFSTGSPKGVIRLFNKTNQTIFATFNITAVVDNGTWVQLTVTHVASNGTFTNAADFVATIVRNGNVGGATAAGNSGELQFNNAGVIAGAANIETEGGNLALTPVASDPTASASNLLIYPVTVAGKVWPKWLAPGEPDNVFQANCHFNNISTIGPGGGTTISVTNCTVTTVGTVSHPVPGTASLRNQTKRFQLISTTTAGALASLRCPVVECWRGNATELGGFFLVMRFTLETLVAGNRGFFGLSSSVAAPTNIDPLADTTLTKVGVGFNTNSGNFFLIHGPNAVAPTTADLGANFPVNNTNFYEFIFHCVPNSSSILYRFRNLTTGAAATNGTISTNLPAVTTFLTRAAWMCNNATAAAVTWHMNKMNLETDY